MSRILAVTVLVLSAWLATARVDAQSAAPSALAAQVSGNAVTLTWQPPSGSVSTYVLEAGSASGLADLVNTPTLSASTTLFVGGVPTGSYYVRVRAYSPATGLSAASNEITVVIVPCSLAPPADLAAVVINNDVSLAWPGVAGATSYQLEAGLAPTLSNAFNGDVGGTQAVQVIAPSGTYYVRVRAKAPSCATSAPSGETIVRVGVITGIGFGGVGDHGSGLGTYMESGFTVDALSGRWTVSRTYGRPLPFIQFLRGAGEPTSSGQIRVTAAGALFRFTSADLYSSVTPIPYVITGLLNSATVFTLTGTVPNTFGGFATVSAATGHLPIDTLLITIDNPATPSCPTCSNPVGVDNIAVSF
jgi:hypothetical protein